MKPLSRSSLPQIFSKLQQLFPSTDDCATLVGGRPNRVVTRTGSIRAA